MKEKIKSNSTHADTHGTQSMSELFVGDKCCAGYLDNISDGVYCLNADGYFIYVNNTILKRSGISRDQFYRLHFLDIVDPEFHDRVKRNFQQVMQGEETIPYELKYKSPGGKIINVEVHSRPIYEGEKIVGLQGISRDITDRKHLEQQTLLANERLQYLLSSTTVVIYTAKPCDYYEATFVSENISQVTGYMPEEFLETSSFWLDHVHPDDVERIIAELPLILELNFYIYEYRFLCKDGRYIWIRDEMKLVRNAAGKPVEIIGYWIDVTERKQLEELLTLSEKKYRDIFDNVPIGLYRASPEGRYLDANPHLARILGYDSPGELIQSITDIGTQVYLKPGDRNEALRLLNEQGYIQNFETGFIKKNGDTLWGSLSAKVVRNEKGNILYLEGISQDITKRKQAEEGLKESEEKFRNLIEAIPIGVFTYEGSKFRYINPACERITGYTCEELHEKDFWETIHPDFQETAREYMCKRQRGEPVPERFELKFITKSGEVRWGERSAIIIERKENPLVLVMVTDVTERKHAEEELMRSEEKYRAVLENASDPILLTDEHGNLIEVNRKAEDFFGYSREELFQMRYTQLHPIAALDRTTAAYKDIVTHGKGGLLNGVMLRKDGTVFPVDITGTAIEYGGKRILQASFRDITEHKQTESTLEELVRERTAELSEKNKQLIEEIRERKRTVASLRKKDKDLMLHARKLEEMNSALKVLLKQREEDKNELEEKVMANVKELLLPYLEKLKTSRLDTRDKTQVSILEANLNSIISPFTHRLSSKYSGFTPREIQVSNLIRQGKSTKDIAELMGISRSAINIYRNQIRHKLGIVSKKINLRAHLMSLSY